MKQKGQFSWEAIAQLKVKGWNFCTHFKKCIYVFLFICFVFVSAYHFYKSIPKSCFFLHMTSFCTYFIRFFISQSDEYDYKPISNHKEMKSTQFFCFQFFSLHTISIKPKCAAQRQYLSESCHLRDVLAEGRIFTKDDEVSSADLGCVTSLGDCMNDCSCHGDFAGCLKGSHEEMERDELEQIIVKRAEQPCVKFRPFKE